MAGSSPHHPIMLHESQRAFLEGPVSIHVASAGPGNVPVITRAVGCRVEPSGRVRLLLPAPAAGAVVEAVERTARVAVAFCRPSTSESIQLKGTGAMSGGCEPEDATLHRAYVDAFAEDAALEGTPLALSEGLLLTNAKDLISLSFSPDEAFVQTPGPSAGARIGG